MDMFVNFLDGEDIKVREAYAVCNPDLATRFIDMRKVNTEKYEFAFLPFSCGNGKDHEKMF